MASDQPAAPPPAPAHVAQAPSRSRWVLLDPFTARHARTIGLSMLRSRREQEVTPNTGYSLGFGEVLTTLRGSFLAGAMLENELRWLPGDGLWLTLSRYQWEAGPRLGPIEPVVRVGLSVMQVGVGKEGPTLGFLSPRVGGGVWLKLSEVRLGFSAFAEYSWRWLGDQSSFVRGLTFEVQPAAPPLRKPRRAPPVVPATSSPSAPASR